MWWAQCFHHTLPDDFCVPSPVFTPAVCLVSCRSWRGSTCATWRQTLPTCWRSGSGCCWASWGWKLPVLSSHSQTCALAWRDCSLRYILRCRVYIHSHWKRCHFWTLYLLDAGEAWLLQEGVVRSVWENTLLLSKPRGQGSLHHFNFFLLLWLKM